MKNIVSFNPVAWGGGALAFMLAVRLIQPFMPDEMPAVSANSLAFNISRSFEKHRAGAEPSLDIITGATQEPKKSAPKAGNDEVKAEAAKNEAAKSEALKEDPSKLEKVVETPKSRSGEASAEPENISVPDTVTGEKTLLERLAARRQQIEEKEKALSEREALLAAAEQRLAQRIEELKTADSELKSTLEAKKNEQATIKPLVTMYETMKPKDAARIFEKLQLVDLLPIAQAMNPRKLADILAQLDPAVAGKLTIGMAPVTAARNAAQITNALPELPDLPIAIR